jgi:hypothetical protein
VTAKQVIKDITDRNGGCYAPVVKEINLHLSMFEAASFVHEGRRSNAEAHNLARHALFFSLAPPLVARRTHNTLLIPVILAFD